MRAFEDGVFIWGYFGAVCKRHEILEAVAAARFDSDAEGEVRIGIDGHDLVEAICGAGSYFYTHLIAVFIFARVPYGFLDSRSGGEGVVGRSQRADLIYSGVIRGY